MGKENAKKNAKIFIVQPMHGKEEQAVVDRALEIFKEAKDSFFKDTYCEMIDNIHHENVPDDSPRLVHLGASIQKLSEASIVIFDKTWGRAKGCRVEFTACVEYGIPAYVYDPDLADPEEDKHYPFLHMKGTPYYDR